ncbi:MAG: hypothetical protein WDZ93_00610 [Candidatus Paceibacterota bacterium]
MGSLLKNAIALLGIAAVLAGGYYMIVLRDSSTINGNNELVADQVERETQAFLAKLEDLRTIELSRAIFTDRRFTTLEDFTGPIVPVPYGRENPFVPR